MSVIFRTMYRFGFTPWDSGVSPPELKRLVEGPDARPPGKALDLGCGTGTNSIYMARHGWQATGVDFVPRAIRLARAKAEAAKATPRLIVGDVTRLDALDVGDGYTLALDQGCLHAIPEARRDAYAAGVAKATSAGADFLIFGFYRRLNFEANVMLTQEQVDHLFSRDWELVRAWGGDNPRPEFPGRWYHLKRR